MVDAELVSLILGLILSLVPFTVVMGALDMFRTSTLSWNGAPFTGITALIASPFLGLCLAAVFTMLLGTCMAPRPWFYFFFRPITLLAKVKPLLLPGEGRQPLRELAAFLRGALGLHTMGPPPDPWPLAGPDFQENIIDNHVSQP